LSNWKAFARTSHGIFGGDPNTAFCNSNDTWVLTAQGSRSNSGVLHFFGNEQDRSGIQAQHPFVRTW